MTRSVWKGPFVHPSLLKKIDKIKDAPNKKPIKTWSRASMIMPEMVGVTIAVHDGRRFLPVLITENMVGHRLGEFASTRTFRSHVNKSDRAVG